LELNDGYVVTPTRLVIADDKNFILNNDNAFDYYSNSTIDYNTRFQSTVRQSWNLKTQKKTSHNFSVYYSAEEKGKEILLTIQGKESAVTLDNGEAIALSHSIRPQWTDVYRSGPHWSGLEGHHGNISIIDPGKPWPDSRGNTWRRISDWVPGKTNSLPADGLTAYYQLNEIISPDDRKYLINVTAGDGTVVFINGKEIFTDLNIERKDSMTYTLLINLVKGKNQLLIKSFNNFQKHSLLGVSEAEQQVIYRKKITTPITALSNILNVDLRLKNPSSPHQSLRLPNVWMEVIWK
jgi:alpha-L-fucosidase